MNNTRWIAALALGAGLGAALVAPSAWAKPSAGARPDSMTPAMSEVRTSEVRGLRLIPAVMPHRVALAPSPWIMRAARGNADAQATIYTTPDGATVGLKLSATGLPNPERLNPAYAHYVVWLRDSETHEMKNIGTLDARNGGEAIFGYQPAEPLTEYDTLVVTPESSAAAGHPRGWDFLTAAIPGAEAQRPRQNLAPAPVDQTPLDDDQGIDRNR